MCALCTHRITEKEANAQLLMGSNNLHAAIQVPVAKETPVYGTTDITLTTVTVVMRNMSNRKACGL
ncbi:MAG: hypothetical protein ABI416_03085 [Ginsengibacter sp.]